MAGFRLPLALTLAVLLSACHGSPTAQGTRARDLEFVQAVGAP